MTLLISILFSFIMQENQENQMLPLNEEEKYVIEKKGTERPFTGKYLHLKAKGLYLCRKCGNPLYTSDSKFDSHCGWPSFDDEIKGAVKRTVDADGSRTEITCAKCQGHLGHVFVGEGLTLKNTRHCVNSVSMVFKSTGSVLTKKDKIVDHKQTAVFALGCFWGAEYYFKKKAGVLSTAVGYTGGAVRNPTYSQVSAKHTGHYEAVSVTYDSSKISYEELVKLFFEIHDPGQENGQGPDIGPQYRSAVFVRNDEERASVKKLIKILKDKGHKVATEILPTANFWKAEEYHQDYYGKNKKTPYCHFYKKKF